jgi:hypothetical protein
VLFSNDYYPAIASDRVSLVPKAIAELCDNGVKTVNGEFRPADVVIYGTGFAPPIFSPRCPCAALAESPWPSGRPRRTHIWASLSPCSRTCSCFMVPTRMWARVDPLHDRVTSPSHRNAHQSRGCSSGSCDRCQDGERATLQHALEGDYGGRCGRCVRAGIEPRAGNPDELAGAYLGLSTPYPEAAQRRLRLEKRRASKVGDPAEPSLADKGTRRALNR